MPVEKSDTTFEATLAQETHGRAKRLAEAHVQGLYAMRANRQPKTVEDFMTEHSSNRLRDVGFPAQQNAVGI